tara:strand:+ start:3040 stop:3858 length:819 start_codon:yes stop_codon:yes gene_type:complete
MSLNIHENIIKKLDYFIEKKQIPNIIFHGPSGSGKMSIVKDFIKKIFNDNNELINNYLMYVNCAHGKGIKFVREELKFFAKTHINIEKNNYYKIIVMSNADYLTIDAQSALRRCIETFSHTTRFFFIVHNKYKLLKPILSRFSEIYIPEPIINNKSQNLYSYLNNKTLTFNTINKEKRRKDLINIFNKIDWKINTNNKLIEVTSKIYNLGLSSLDIINYIEKSNIEDVKKYQLLILFNKIKIEFRCEKTLILFMLHYIFIRSVYNLENILFM